MTRRKVTGILAYYLAIALEPQGISLSDDLITEIESLEDSIDKEIEALKKEVKALRKEMNTIKTYGVKYL